MKLPHIVAATGVALCLGATQAAAEVPLRVVGTFTQNTSQVAIEKRFFESLSEVSGVELAANFNPADVVGVKATDSLRLLRSGLFDVMSVQIGMTSRDDPFFEGVDLIGVATDMSALREVVEAYREPFDQRLQERFNAKALTFWPFGPQVFYCNQEINSLADLSGLKVRSFTPSMSAMLEDLNAIPVTLQFSEVYPALQRGVISCGVTSPISGNTGNWPEVTSHLLPLSVSGSMQGHFVSLDTWDKFTDEEKAALEEQFSKLEEELWTLAIEANDDAVACNIGSDACSGYDEYDMTLVEISDADYAKVNEIAETVVLPIWKETCNAVDSTCSDVWNETAGAAAGLTIK